MYFLTLCLVVDLFPHIQLVGLAIALYLRLFVYFLFGFFYILTGMRARCIFVFFLC